MTRTPRVRVVVLNYDGGEMTVQCLRALREIDWPADALEIMLVDNASIDGLAPRIRREMPWVRLVEHTHNVGFAGGCNLGLRDLGDVDYVALLNNDAIPDRNWLRGLVDALETDPGLGAANSKIVFAPSFVSLSVESPTFRPASDQRDLGVKITDLNIDGERVWDHAQFADGCYSTATRGSDGERLVWTAERAEVRVPVTHDAALPDAVDVELSAEKPKTVVLAAGNGGVDAAVDQEPSWHRVNLAGPTFDVINNVGSRLVTGGYGGDRGFLEPDRGQYEQPEEVFAWCGGAVLLSARYLREVGIFDDRYFMYYEDTDLSWRGRLAGWRYVYVPNSIVRHAHAASSKEGSALFIHFVERNRFNTLARNAPWPMVRDAVWVFLRDTLVIFRRDVLSRVVRRGRPAPRLVVRRLRAFVAFLRMLPSTLVSRWRQRVSRAHREELVRRWSVPQ
jgi:GT2 family glycosyltransferase